MSQGKDAGRFNSAFNLLYFFATPVGNLVIGLILLLGSSSSSPSSPSAPFAAAPISAAPVESAPLSAAAPFAAAAAAMSVQDILLYVLLAIGILGSLLFLLISYVQISCISNRTEPKRVFFFVFVGDFDSFFFAVFQMMLRCPQRAVFSDASKSSRAFSPLEESNVTLHTCSTLDLCTFFQQLCRRANGQPVVD